MALQLKIEFYLLFKKKKFFSNHSNNFADKKLSIDTHNAVTANTKIWNLVKMLIHENIDFLRKSKLLTNLNFDHYIEFALIFYYKLIWKKFFYNPPDS